MSIPLIFFDWDKNPLIQTAQWLIEKAEDHWLDLSSYILVLPGRHAADRLFEILVQDAEKDAIVLTPPTFLTTGHLPEELYKPSRPFASNLQQWMAWREAFTRIDRDEVQAVFPKPPSKDEFSKWMGMVQSVDQLHRDLASQMCSFRDAKRAAQALGLGAEVRRWELLQKVQTHFWKVLEENGYWDKQTARRLAVVNDEIHCNKNVVMVGATDLPKVLREMIQKAGSKIESLVFCDPDDHAMFDEAGCIKIPEWVARTIKIPEEKLSVATKPDDQARQVVRKIQETEGRYSANQVVIGLPDDRMGPVLESHFLEKSLKVRQAKGKPIKQTEFMRLLAAIGDFVSTGEFTQFSALIRHPVFSNYVDRRIGDRTWAEEVANWFQFQLPYDVLASKSHANKEVQAVIDLIGLTLEPLLGGKRRKLTSWPEQFHKVFQSLFENREVDRESSIDRDWIASVKEIADAFEQVRQIPKTVDQSVRVDEFLDLVYRLMQGKQISEPTDPEKIEMLGWLDLPMDDAPVAILTSFNEGYIPSSDSAHPFLTQQLRRRLDLVDNRRRYARDAYSLELLLNSKEFAHLIVGKLDTAEDPLTPSRLALALDGLPLARRAQLLFEESSDHAHTEPTVGQKVEPSRLLEVPKPIEFPSPMGNLRVTDFKSYMQCPYRFYLQRVLKLQSWDDLSEEMEGSHFGSLLHDVLEDFAKSPYKDSSDEKEISEFLVSGLGSSAFKLFGKKKRPAIEIQIKQAELRLARFATLQAERRSQGWVIDGVEIKGSATWEVGDHSITVSGRIDRVDVHQDTGQYAIWDYKTSDSSKKLQEMYFKTKKSEEWLDLQLPLYRHLLQERIGKAKARAADLGIVFLPKNLEGVAFEVASWSPELLKTADEKIEEILGLIANQEFWPPSEDPGFDDGIERICQTSVAKF